MTRARSLSLLANANILTAEQTNNRVGIGSTIPDAKLDVDGDIVVGTAITIGKVSGIVSATDFYVDGISITGAAGTWATFTSGGEGGISTTKKVKIENSLEVTGVSTFSGNLTVGGVLSYADVTNVDSVGIITARSTIDAQGAINLADSIIHTGDTNTKIRFPAADTFTVETGGSERIRVDSSGNFGVGTASPGSELHLVAGDTNCSFKIVNSSGGSGGLIQQNGSDFNFNNLDSGNMRLYTADTERLRIDSSGRLLLGTTTEGHVSADDFTVAGSGDVGITIRSGTGSEGSIMFSDGTSGDDEYRGWINYNQSSNFLRFFTNATEAFRVDSSQRFLIGHTSDVMGNQVQSFTTGGNNYAAGRFVNSTGGPDIVLRKSRNATVGSHTIVQDNDDLGNIFWGGSNGSAFKNGARITASVDGTPGSGDDMPARLTFFTSAESSSSPTERLRIDSTGRVLLNGGADARANMLNSTFTSQFQIEGTGHTTSSMSMVRNSDNGGSPYLTLGKSRSTSVNGAGLVSSGDGLGVISWQGGDGSNLIEAAAILAQVDSTAATDDMPGRLAFYTTSDGAAAATERARIDSSGNVNIGPGAGPRRRLDITGPDGRSGASPGNSDTALIIDNDAGNGAIMEFLSDNNAFGRIFFTDTDASNRGQIVYEHSGDAFQFSTAGSERVRITSAGHVRPGADNTQDLGSTSLRWANIYSADLQLSNEGMGNDVDGTWGKYTIQEGENDLFLLNRRNGKKYRFMLEEV